MKQKARCLSPLWLNVAELKDQPPGFHAKEANLLDLGAVSAFCFHTKISGTFGVLSLNRRAFVPTFKKKLGTGLIPGR